MDLTNAQELTDRYAKCVEVSKRVRWDIDRDVIRGRSLDFDRKFLPDALTRVDRLGFLTAPQRRLLGHVQGRTYANTLGMIERYISAKTLELGRGHAFGDQLALEALVRFTDEELKHQELFRRLERLAAAGMPPGYRFVPDVNDVAAFVLGKSTWAVLALTFHIELLTQAHYREAIAPDPELSDLFKDVFFFHWKEESQHAIIDELEWRREDARIAADERDRAVEDLIALLVGIDGTLQPQAAADASYFDGICGRSSSDEERAEVERALLGAYRWQYVASGLCERRFADTLGELVTKDQRRRIDNALSPLMQGTTRKPNEVPSCRT